MTSDKLLRIQKKFFKGMDKVFRSLFTEEVFFCFMDENTPVDDVYNESEDKRYLSQYPLTGKVVTEFKRSELPIEDIRVDCIVTLPAKQLLDYGLVSENITNKELEDLKKGVIIYKGLEYLIDYVHPKTLVADAWQFYAFYCYIDRPRGGI